MQFCGKRGCPGKNSGSTLPNTLSTEEVLKIVGEVLK